MKQYLDQLREVQVRLSGFHDGLEAKSIELDSPFVYLLVDELNQAARAIDFVVSQIEQPKKGMVSKCGSIAVSDYDQIMTDGL